MHALWARGRATAEEVRLALSDLPHDSTVRTLLRVLEEKGYVRHQTEGKSYVYHPVIARAKAQRTAVKSLLCRFFGGSAEGLVLRLLEDNEISPHELQELLRSAPKPKKPRAKGESP
jgi:predicted transcriptional regulator